MTANVLADDMLDWTELPELPAELGVAGPFAGVSQDALIVAGGANFPNGVPWDGGEKVWYDDIYVLDRTEGEWRTGFSLPRPLAYGASVTTDGGLLCIGGCDGDRCYSDVFMLNWNPVSGDIDTKFLPSLPEPLAFMSAARIGDVVYVAGGQSTMSDADATNTFWSLNLVDGAKWTKLSSWNGPSRILPVLAAQHDGTSDKVYLFSGRDFGPDREVNLLRDVQRFDPGAGTWTKLSDAPRCLMAGMGSAMGAHHIMLAGGDDGAKLLWVKQLITASVMSAPAALAIGKLMYPEEQVPETRGSLELDLESPDVNVIDAAARGAHEGLHLALNVGAMLLAFIALVYLADAMFGWLGGLVGFEGLSIALVLGWALAPLAWLMGVPWADAPTIAGLMGIKTVLNEFFAYIQLSGMLSGAQNLQPRSVIIATYALSGFANFSSIAVQIGGIGGIAPSRRHDLSRIGLRAMIAGSLAAFLTGTIAGMVL